jgi:hypothetical protein
VNPSYYLVLSAALFTIGAVGVLVRRNAIVVFMCVELMLNAVNLSLVTSPDQRPSTGAFFVMRWLPPRWSSGLRSSCRSSVPSLGSVDDSTCSSTRGVRVSRE